MPVRKRGRTWHVDFTAPGGSRTRVTVGRGSTREQALELEARLRSDFHAGRVGRSASHTVSEAFSYWLTHEAKGLAWYKDLAFKVKTFTPFLKERPLERAAEVAEDAKAAWLEKKLDPITINRRLATLRRVCKLAWKKWGWLDKPVFIELLQGERPRTVRLTPEQAQKWLDSFDDAEARDLLLLDFLVGLRPWELRALTRPPAEGGWNLDGDRLRIVAPKTHRERSIPLVAAARAIARRLPLEVTPDRMRYALERARERAGMPWAQLRDARKSFGSWIVQRTGSLKAAQELLGHKDIQITARHYAALLDEHLEEAVGSLPRLNSKSQRRHIKRRR